MSNSPLVTYTKLSPNCTKPRNHKIDTITIHCTAGNGTAESILNLSWFVNYDSKAGASCNYVIGYDGSIGLGVEEKNRSWCTSNRENDHRAITIEVSSSNKPPYVVSNAAYRSLINLLVDICKRNKIPELRWKADKSLIGQPDKQNMTVHRWFANKECPGEYLYSRHGQIAEEVNSRLNETTPSDPANGKENCDNYTKISGDSVATIDQMITYIKIKNPNIPQSVLGMTPFYLSEGEAEGIRGDVAFAQSCVETGNFTFPQSTCAVTLDQNNFCMMGVINTFDKGNSFDTPQLGIRAQIQHLKAYANSESLNGECIDPRFKYVSRGCAPYVEWLGMKENPKGKGWASAKDYGAKILRVLNEIISIKTKETSVTPEKPTESPSSSTDTAKNPYLVKVSIPNLNIRKGPGTNYARTGYFTGVGIFTIVEARYGEGSESGWGKLKSGAGWISLDYAKRV